MQVRILHIDGEEPWIPSERLINMFDLTNPALKRIERILIVNALPLIENVGWQIGLTKELETGMSVLFIKKDIENE
jgi:hypothetical protein